MVFFAGPVGDLGMDVLSTVAHRLAGGERLSREEGLTLLAEPDLIGLARLARAQKEQRSGDRVFYNVNCHINLTNVCVARCAFCAFSCDPPDARAYVLTPQQVVERVGAAMPAGITEVHMVSGLHPDMPFSYYLDVVRAIRGAFPDLHIKAFTAVEIHYFAAISGLAVAQVLTQLQEAGLDSLPGGGAEVLSDRVRTALCPRKATAHQWLEVMRAAHRQGLKSNATILFGHIETPGEIIDHLLQIRTLQDETGGFQAFIPLPFHPANTRLRDRRKPAAIEILRLFSVARLMLDNVPHLKAYWIMTGLDVAQLSLLFGADDVDGTVMDEKITHAAGAETAPGVDRRRLVSLIRGARLEPVQRDTLYRVLRVGD